MVDFKDIIHFWFQELKPQDHFRKNPDLDLQIKTRFAETLEKAKKGELYPWRNSALGRLAEIIVLDQFSRNIFRDSPLAFAGDPQAIILAQEAVRQKADVEVERSMQNFFYMPYMHSESQILHEEAVQLFSKPGLEGSLEYEILHKKIIDRFGRFPHRNQILGRVSTPEEIEFLKQPGSSF